MLSPLVAFRPLGFTGVMSSKGNRPPSPYYLLAHEFRPSRCETLSHYGLLPLEEKRPRDKNHNSNNRNHTHAGLGAHTC